VRPRDYDEFRRQLFSDFERFVDMSTTRQRFLEWKNRSRLPQLPVEIWSQIFMYLYRDDLCSVRLVSRMFYTCVNQYTHFWSSVIFDVDHCPMPLVTSNYMRHVRLSNMNLLTRTNLYTHCTVYFHGQLLSMTASKALNHRRRRHDHRLLSSNTNDVRPTDPYIRCSSIHFQSFRLFESTQLEYLLRKRVRHLTFSYECLPNEPSVNFLIKLDRLKSLKIHFVHHIHDVDIFTETIIRMMQTIVLIIFQLKRYVRTNETCKHRNSIDR
jgi:hypothetical protein